MFSSNVIEHIVDIGDFHVEMQRVMKPNGIAIHVVPSATWRFWTNIMHYPFVLINASKLLYIKILSFFRINSDDALIEGFSRTAVGFSKLDIARMIIVPVRHGEKGNAFSEMIHFSRYGWKSVFRKGGWCIDNVNSNELFYTGFLIFGGKISMNLRKRISRFLGGSCHIFVLRKK